MASSTLDLALTSARFAPDATHALLTSTTSMHQPMPIDNIGITMQKFAVGFVVLLVYNAYKMYMWPKYPEKVIAQASGKLLTFIRVETFFGINICFDLCVFLFRIYYICTYELRRNLNR